LPSSAGGRIRITLCVMCLIGCRLPGMTRLRFKPAYNPYTEPSMEVFSYHEG